MNFNFKKPKQAVIRITAKTYKGGRIDKEKQEIVESQDNYELAKNPLFQFVYDEIQRIRKQENPSEN